MSWKENRRKRKAEKVLDQKFRAHWKEKESKLRVLGISDTLDILELSELLDIRQRNGDTTYVSLVQFWTKVGQILPETMESRWNYQWRPKHIRISERMPDWYEYREEWMKEHTL